MLAAKFSHSESRCEYRGIFTLAGHIVPFDPPDRVCMDTIIKLC